MCLIDCCESRKVSSECQARFCGGSALIAPISESAAFQCYTEIDKVFSCLAGGYNNIRDTLHAHVGYLSLEEGDFGEGVGKGGGI